MYVYNDIVVCNNNGDYVCVCVCVCVCIHKYFIS